MTFIEGLIGASVNALGAAGQRKAAMFAYRVYQKKTKSRIDWEDMTQREQESWMIAVWDVMKNKGE